MENVSIHAPREGCDDLEAITPLCRSKFQFTHPGRGATGKTATLTEDARRFNSRTPGGVRPTSPRAPSICRQRFNSRTPGGVRLRVRPILVRGLLGFNSRTPGGVRHGLLVHGSGCYLFQFTHPGRGATEIARLLQEWEVVSIHAPREGCDSRFALISLDDSRFQFTHPGRGATSLFTCVSKVFSGFNSRTPGGVRHLIMADVPNILMFQFTHPGRGATNPRETAKVASLVSIHAPREGCDILDLINLSSHALVSIHAPREGCDFSDNYDSSLELVFQFTHPGRGATPLDALHVEVGRCFNSRTPGGVRPHLPSWNA